MKSGVSRGGAENAVAASVRGDSGSVSAGVGACASGSPSAFSPRIPRASFNRNSQIGNRKSLRLLAALLGLGVVVLTTAGLGLYPSWTRGRAARWERAVERDAAGLMAGAGAYDAGNGEVGLLMVHGFASSPAVFQRMAPELAARGYRCRAVRLPGFGESPWTAQFSAEAWREAVDAEAAALRRSCRSVWVVGHSLGGTLALDHVLRGGRVDGLVLIAPLIEVADTRSPLLPPRTWFELGLAVWPEHVLIETAFDADLREPAPWLDERRDRFLPLSAYRELFRVRDAVAGRAGEIACPVFTAVAPRDRVVDSGAAVAYAAGMGSGDTVLWQQRESGHVMPLDAGWHELSARVDAFVRAEVASADYPQRGASNRYVPAFRIPLGMEDRQDDNPLLVLDEKDCIGKAPRERATHGSVHQRVLLRSAQDGAKDGVYAKQEFGAQTGDAVVIPVERLRHLRFGFRADDKTAGHRLPLIRSRTMPHGEPSSGFRWYASSRRSSSAFCSPVSPTSSGTSAMVSQMSSTSWMRSGTLKLNTSDLARVLMAFGTYHSFPSRPISRFDA